jgi:uncharacterized protein YxeA
LLPKSIKCPSNSPSHQDSPRKGLSGGSIAAIVLVIIGVIIVIGFLWGYNKRRNTEFSKYFPWKKAGKAPVYDENFSTALDDDLLEEKEAEAYDDNGNTLCVTYNNSIDIEAKLNQ